MRNNMSTKESRRFDSAPSHTSQNAPSVERSVEKVTRLTVVNHSFPRHANEPIGRLFEKWDIAVDLSFQDCGRTLKVFVTDQTRAVK